MKKIGKKFKLTALLTAVLMLCSCGQAGAGDNAGTAEAPDVSGETDILTDMRETAAETEETGEVTEEKPRDTAVLQTAPPDFEEMTDEDRELIEKLRSGQTLVLYPDGRVDVSESVGEEIYNISFFEYLLSEETVDMMIEEGEYSSKEEYLEYLKEYFPEIEDMTDSEGNITAKIEPAVYITIPEGYYSGGEYGEDNEDGETAYEVYCRVVQWVIGLMKGDSEMAQSLLAAVEDKGYCLAGADYYYDEDGIITAGLESYDIGDNGVQMTEKFHISGRPGVMIGEHFVFADTKKLAVTSRSRTVYEMLTSDLIPEDCELIAADDEYNGRELRVDMAEIAEKLPGLTELHMYQVNADNIESIEDMENLEVLTYYVSEDASAPFTKLRGLKKLWLCGNYDDYSFLNEMDMLDELHITYWGDDKNIINSLFECKVLTSLEINPWGGDLKLDISGVEKLTRLKKLDITGSDIDFAIISRLPGLEDLHVRCIGGEMNVQELKEAPKLKRLSLSESEIMDWEFLADMPVLEELDLMFISSVANEDITPLKNLKRLSLIQTGCDSTVVDGMEELEEFIYNLNGGHQDYSKLSTCKSLRKLCIIDSGGVVDLKDIENAPLEIINTNGTSIINPQVLAEIKTLKSVHITVKDNIACEEMMREALPECELHIYDEHYFD